MKYDVFEDHPRACGENWTSTTSASKIAGSPPRMRGKLASRRVYRATVRITPAHAGKTMLCCGFRSTRRDHPRACGENLSSAPRWKYVLGSPPRMRGKHKSFESIKQSIRITPAHAGKTYTCFGCSAEPEDHPRACGENGTGKTTIAKELGSPPRMRGKPPPPPPALISSRITPAHAGKTSKRNCSRRTRQDHPRACGENPVCYSCRSKELGSPPRMRGKRRRH